jgi:hypothetical protein
MFWELLSNPSFQIDQKKIGIPAGISALSVQAMNSNCLRNLSLDWFNQCFPEQSGKNNQFIIFQMVFPITTCTNER